jgi:hypothetical protein
MCILRQRFVVIRLIGINRPQDLSFARVHCSVRRARFQFHEIFAPRFAFLIFVSECKTIKRYFFRVMCVRRFFFRTLRHGKYIFFNFRFSTIWTRYLDCFPTTPRVRVVAIVVDSLHTFVIIMFRTNTHSTNGLFIFCQ